MERTIRRDSAQQLPVKRCQVVREEGRMFCFVSPQPRYSAWIIDADDMREHGKDRRLHSQLSFAGLYRLGN